MAKVQSVLIVGGGIGGLALSVGLRQAGIDADVVEIKKQWAIYHVGIIVESNFIRALLQLGLADRAVAAGFPYNGIRYCDANGNVFKEPPNANLAGPGYPLTLGLTRPALHKVLFDASQEWGARVRLGLTIADFKQSADKVAVKFTDGSSGEYDLVVGADGVHSQIREMLFGDKYVPKYTGEGVWRYSVPRPPDLDHGLLYVSREGPKSGLIPLTQESAYIFRIGPEPANHHFPHAELANTLRDRLKLFGGVIGKLSAHITDPDQVVYRPLWSVLVSPPWYQGRVVLLGDATHSITPHLGQGAAQAVEDVVVLAEVLQKDAPLEELLDAFVERRYERCKFILQASLQLGEWEQHPDPKADPISLWNEVERVIVQPI
ncbi:MAG TPA: FAD-dependent monooxygenase [Patescibacteria group bacterium]|nr:FAD-dependent monooxygenase [Patescibacteria group bacterium]